MPTKRKAQKKTKEEKYSENYYPVSESDLKRSIEKVHKNIDYSTLEIVEKVGTKKTGKKSYKKFRGKKKTSSRKISRKNFSKKTSNEISYTPPEINLKKGGYELVITEKPQAATKIADALGKSVKKNVAKIPYYEVSRGKDKIVVGCAVGHLFTLKQKHNGKSGEAMFDISWVPNFYARKGDFSKKYFDVMLSLAKKAGSVTVATDYDIEGEVIGYNIVRFIAGQPDASRMKFSTLTKNELNNAYENKMKSINWGQAIAGETRHYLDWFYGINLSRALMNAIKTTGRFKLMSIGRVQGPALHLIVDREKEIQKFKPETYWQIFIRIRNEKGVEIDLKHTKDIFDKKELEKFKDLKGKKVEAKTDKREQNLPPNPPFNLTTLQTESYKFFGTTPSQTLQVAQGLYLASLISYPRTSSQKLPASLGYDKILKELAERYKKEHLIKRKEPVEGTKTDPAHPSIYPTGQEQVLSGRDEKIYDLIVKRFLSLFCEDAIIDRKTISVELGDLGKFTANGQSISKKAWLEIYPSKLKEEQLPDVEGEVEIIDARFEEKETQPPKRYSPASILSELEKRNLGTKATRAAILETLYDRNYVKGQSVEATALGISLIDTLKKYSPIIIDEQLTREFEEEMEAIQEAKKDLKETQKKVIDKSKKQIVGIMSDFDKHDKKIGAELLNANIEQIEQQKIDNTLMTCPKCKKGNLFINYSRKNKRYFVACDDYPNCTNTYTLPPNGLIKRVESKKTEKKDDEIKEGDVKSIEEKKDRSICEKCGWPMLMRLSQGKRPWIFCFNPDCETNREWVEKAREKREEYEKNGGNLEGEKKD